MSAWLFAVIVQKFVLFAFLVTCAAVLATCRLLPDGWLKRFLLMDVRTRVW